VVLSAVVISNMSGYFAALSSLQVLQPHSWWHPNGSVGALALLVLHGVLPGAFEEFNPIRGPFRRRIQCD
jgi:hypothetical protein